MAGRPPPGLRPRGAPPPGLSPRGALPRGAPPRGSPPPGIPPRGASPPGIPPRGASPPGIPPRGGAPRGSPQTAESQFLSTRPPPAAPPRGPPLSSVKSARGPVAKGEGGVQKKKMLTAAQLEEVKECFMMFDKDNDGYISSKEIGVLMMSLGMSPTRKELEDTMKNIRPSRKGHVSLPEFLDIMRNDNRKRAAGEEIMEGFKIYDQMMSSDRDNGKIAVKELQQVMTSFGEKLNPEEMSGMLKFAEDCTFAGEINYARFVDKMMNPNKYRGNPAI